MKPALGSRFSFLICAVTCLAYSGAEESLCTKGAICARGLLLPIGEEPRPVGVWAESGSRVRVFGPGVERPLPTTSEGKWLNFTATQRGSEFCVSSETFPEKEFCDKDRDWLGLWSDPETKWNLAPDNVVSGCSQYSLLGLSLELHDSPTKLLWRPGERAESLNLDLWESGGSFKFSRKADSQLPYDLTFRSASEDGSCVVTSASLDVSRTCQMNQTGIFVISIESLDDNFKWTPSYFSFNCEDGAGWQTGSTTSSPDDNSTEESPSDTLWYIAAVLGFAIVISLIEAVARRAKTCQGDPVRPSAALPSTSPAGTQEPPPPSPSSSSSPPPPPPPPQLLLQRNSFGPPDGQGSAQEHYGSEGGEHEYEYVELDTSRTQLAREEEDAREPDNEPVQPACSLRRDTVNSIYFLSDELSGRM
ncbi:uncharacterized protein [Penaeus vannamei]|uniref:uncharacterized protein isoform X2 n=1 Tax=Penaeus vannamei TaxID=6689 RepID=UPI00387F8FAF